MGGSTVRFLAWQEVASGKRRGPSAAVARWALAAASLPYAAAVRWRNRRYDAGAAQCVRLAVPVLSVGNLTVGGTGKTPTVEWHARWFAQRGRRVVIVSRGYRSGVQGRNDEALELEQRLPDVPHIQNPDRVAGAREAIERHGCQVVILDDGFQHRRLGRDLDLVLLDALEPFGYGHVLPRGLLREPPDGLRRAHGVLLTRSDLVSAEQREEIREQVQRLAPQAIWLEAEHRPKRLLAANKASNGLDGTGLAGAACLPESPTWLQGRRVAAFCGIGNPTAFRRTLERCGCQVVAWRAFPDHHAYPPSDVAELARWADASPAEAVLCTHKDLVKLQCTALGSRPLAALVIGLEIVAGLVAWEARLAELG